MMQTGTETVCAKFKTLAQEKIELVSAQKQVEAERLAHMQLQTKLLEGQIRDQEEKLSHNQMLRALEIEENKKKKEHNELIRKLELEKLG